MKSISTTLGVLIVALLLVPGAASAQQPDTAGASRIIDVHPGLTADEFAAFAAELGSVLRFRQLGDARTLPRGAVDLGIELASTPLDIVSPTVSFPRLAARFGVSDRVDIGAWGGVNTRAHYGLAGADVKVALVEEGPRWPVTFSIRPGVTTLIGPSEVWAASASVDLTVSRTFGALSPYAGVASTASLAVERSAAVDLDPATAEGSFSYAGLAYRWRTISASAEVQKGDQVSYALRIGTRF